MSHWKNKVVVITGGSDGLGLAIGKQFAIQGATTVLLARTESRLKEVVQANTNLKLDWVVCDVTNDESVSATIATIVKRHQRIDVWVNNVGKSTRIEFESCSIEEYQRFLDINFFSAVRCTLAVLGQLKSTSGQVVNIGSLASKTGWPNVAPYSVSKHALASFSHQLRLEGPKNVNCMLVCPGPVRRADSEQRYTEQAKFLDENASKPGAGVKLKGICPELLSQKIVRACEKRKKDLVVPWRSRILFAISQISPALGDWILSKSSK